MGDISTLVGSVNDYSIVFHPIVEDAVLAEDIPLAPFSVVKTEVEKLIEAGYIRDIYKVRLVYARYYNPDDLGNTYILAPVWEFNGIITDGPKAPTPNYSDEEKEALRKYGGRFVLIDAQTAQYFNPDDTRPNRSYSNYITWDEVK